MISNQRISALICYSVNLSRLLIFLIKAVNISFCYEQEELQRQVSDGSWTPKGHDDVLTRALGSKEHGGRVRGVGGGAKLKDVFGSGKSKHSGVVSVDELATITQEITKKVQKECEERMNEMVRKNEMVNLKLESIFNQLNQMGVKIPDDHFLNDVGTPNNENVRSSCQSVYREDHFTNVKVYNIKLLFFALPFLPY